MNLLQDFKDKPFIEAVQSFFKNLNVPVNEITTAPATAIDIIGENPVNAAINEVYAYGIVDDAILESGKKPIDTCRSGHVACCTSSLPNG